MKFEIWYMKPDYFGEGISGGIPDKENLDKTHVLLRSIVVEDWTLEKVFSEMQAENWSPNGEGRHIIESKGLGHTSMSVGDVVVRDGKVFLTKAVGFQQL